MKDPLGQTSLATIEAVEEASRKLDKIGIDRPIQDEPLQNRRLIRTCRAHAIGKHAVEPVTLIRCHTQEYNGAHPHVRAGMLGYRTASTTSG